MGNAGGIDDILKSLDTLSEAWSVERNQFGKYLVQFRKAGSAEAFVSQRMTASLEKAMKLLKGAVSEQSSEAPEYAAHSPLQPSKEEANEPAVCGECNSPLEDGARFCGRCRKPVMLKPLQGPPPQEISPPGAGPVSCHQCGAPLEEDAKFCVKCGTSFTGRMPSAPQQPLTCSQCGIEIKEGSLFCKNCGTPVTTSAQARPQVAPPPPPPVRVEPVPPPPPPPVPVAAHPHPAPPPPPPAVAPSHPHPHPAPPPPPPPVPVAAHHPPQEEKAVPLPSSCPKCQAKLRKGIQFCVKCGATIGVPQQHPPEAERAPIPNTCPKCQAKLRKGAKFCPKCGGHLQ